MTLRKAGPRPTLKYEAIWGQQFNDGNGSSIVNGRWTKGTLLKGPWSIEAAPQAADDCAAARLGRLEFDSADIEWEACA
jgi:hypothetical protein